MHAVLSVVAGGSSHETSIVYNGVQLALSIYVILICNKDFHIEKGKTFLKVLSLSMILYSLRMFIDMFAGPFSSVVSASQVFNDMLFTIGGVFFPTWAMISSRKYLDLERVCRAVFWIGLITCIFVVIGVRMNGISFEDERVVAGRGLHSLALAKLGAVQLIISLHMFMQSSKRKYVYAFGFIVGGFIALISGSRGGVAGAIIAMGFYIVVAARKKLYLMVIGILVVIFFIVNLVPILEWVGNYFPVFSGRMLEAVLESDTGGRDVYFERAVQYIFENPITGFGYRINADSTGYGPHNGLLEILLCFGIPLGLFFILYLYLISTVYAVKMMVDKRFVFPSLMVIFSISSSFSGSSISESKFVFSMALLGIAYYYYYKGCGSNTAKNR